MFRIRTFELSRAECGLHVSCFMFGKSGFAGFSGREGGGGLIKGGWRIWNKWRIWNQGGFGIRADLER